jgi:hypothetical protein
MPPAERGARARETLVRSEPAERRHPAPDGPRADPLLQLQGVVGNRVVTELLAAGQPKLDVGPAGDHLEEEADEVARQVVGLVGSPGPGRLADDTDPYTVARLIQRYSVPEVGPEGGTLSPETESAIAAARSGGSALAGGVRHEMERAFGADFGAVRLHAGPGAADLNRTLQSTAFTIGRDIFFGSGVPDTGDRAGRQLLAHELTHTIQQGASPLVSEDDQG